MVRDVHVGPPFHERAITACMVLVCVLITVVVIGAAGESVVSPLETFGLVLVVVAINGAITWFGVRTIRSGVTIGADGIRIARASRVRLLRVDDVRDFHFDDRRRLCVARLVDGNEVVCSTIGYGPGAPRRVREATLSRVRCLNEALELRRASSARH